MNKKKRIKNRENAERLRRIAREKLYENHTCENCGEKGAHWVSMGNSLEEIVMAQHGGPPVEPRGFWTCDKMYGPDSRRLDTSDSPLMSMGGAMGLLGTMLRLSEEAKQDKPVLEAKELFEQSSALMRRVKRGALRGEVDHPQRMPGESMDDFVNRYISIDPKNTCAHISEIWLDFNSGLKGPDGKPCVAIMGKVAPSGAKGDFLKRQFENGKENVCFSIRSFTYDYVERGLIKRVLKNVITFDYVNEPGIVIAEKYNSPALESLTETRVNETQLRRALTRELSPLAMESRQMNADELFASLGWSLPAGQGSILSNWK